MDDETRTWTTGGQPLTGPPSSRGPAYTPSIATYTTTALKTIGQKCSGRLPPANAVQAMFLYEMQRQTEEEQLFKNQMFRLARAEDASTTQERRIKELEAKIVQLEKAMTKKEVEERLATSKSTMQMLGEKVSCYLKRMEDLEAVMIKVKSRVEGTEKALEEKKKGEDVEDAAPELKTAFAMMKAEIDVLFEDRDGMLAMINEIKERLASREAPSAADDTTTAFTSSRPPILSRAASVPPTGTINGVSLTSDTREVNLQPDQTRSAAAAEEAVVEDEAEKECLDNEESDRQFAGMKSAEKAEAKRERAYQDKKAKETERPACAPPGNIASAAAAPHLRPGQNRTQTISLTNVANGLRPQTQRLHVQTTSSSSTAPLDLSIPKGAPHVGLRSSVHAPRPVPTPSNLRLFSPGKPWAS